MRRWLSLRRPLLSPLPALLSTSAAAVSRCRNGASPIHPSTPFPAAPLACALLAHSFSAARFNSSASSPPPPSSAAVPPLPAPSSRVSYGLAGRTALVTGGSSGIGFAIARLLAEQGVQVALTSRSIDRAQVAAGRITQQLLSSSSLLPFLSPLPFACDVRDSVSVDRCVETAYTALGHRLDIVVHAAGVNEDALLARAKDDMIDDLIQTNLVGSIYLCRSVTRKWLAARAPRSASSSSPSPSTPLSSTSSSAASSSPSSSSSSAVGAASKRLILIGSIVGQQGNAGQSVYAATKAGMQGLALSLSKELASRHVTVNCVCPGYVESPMTAALPPAARAELLARMPGGQFGQADDVAHTVAFLASERASFITGQILAVDGGMRKA